MADVLNLDEQQIPPNDCGPKMKDAEIFVRKNVGENELSNERAARRPSHIDKLREELSCAICLEICFKPSTTPCGHSFCRKCLKRVAVKCHKCPQCRQFIRFGPCFRVNTVIWNTIQLLFPQEVEARKIAPKNVDGRAIGEIVESVSEQAAVNVPSYNGFAMLSRFSPGDVIEMRVEVMEKNIEEMALAIKDLNKVEPTNQTPPSSSNFFWKILNSVNIFCT